MLWLFDVDLFNSKYHLKIIFENHMPKVNKQDKDLWVFLPVATTKLDLTCGVDKRHCLNTHARI